MAKEGKLGGNKNKRKIIAVVILAIIVLLTTVIVLGITYWPAKASDVTSSFDSVINSSLDLNNEDSGYKTVQDFIIQKIGLMENEARIDTSETDKKDGYIYEMKSFKNIMTAVSRASYYVDLTFESSVKGGFVKKDVKALQSYLKDSSVNLELMAKHITNHKKEMTNFTVVLSVWEGIRDYYKTMVKDYVDVFVILDKIYSKQNTNGIYGNKAATLSIRSTKSYISVIYKNLFDAEKGVSKVGYDASVLFKNFVKVLDISYMTNILNYYLSSICQDNCEKIELLEEMTDKKVNFEYLIEHGFNVSELSLTSNQLMYVNVTEALLKGDDLTSQKFVEEVTQDE